MKDDAESQDRNIDLQIKKGPRQVLLFMPINKK